MAKEQTSCTIDKGVKALALERAGKITRSLSYVIEEALKLYLKTTKAK